MTKTMIHPQEILPGRSYSVAEAARYLGVHRCTVYDYIRMYPERLHTETKAPGEIVSIRGKQLIAFKAAGLPKRGRKRMSDKQLPQTV